MWESFSVAFSQPLVSAITFGANRFLRPTLCSLWLCGEGFCANNKGLTGDHHRVTENTEWDRGTTYARLFS
jgi:hypothetical protein